MDIKKVPITTEDEYANFVRQYATLLDEQMKDFEKWMAKNEEVFSLAEQMPALISAVNVMGYLRGNDGMFSDFRPHVGQEQQNEFYAYENDFEMRLRKIINFMMTSGEKEHYQERLEDYLVKVRTKYIPIEA